MTRARTSNLLLIVSLILLGLTLPGYLGILEIDFRTSITAGAVLVGGGRFVVLTTRVPSKPPGPSIAFQSRLHPEFTHRMLDGFDAHFLPAITGGPSKVFLFSFPLWCILLPSLIAPIIWLRDRRRRDVEKRGFPVEPKTQTSIPPAADRSP